MDIIVIGAGLSGLTAAAKLRDAGCNVQVLEADTQIGGRIQSLRDPISQEALADLGPTWVWPQHQPVAARWLNQLGLSTFGQFNEGDAVILGYGPTAVRQHLPGQNGMARIIGGPTAAITALAQRVGHANIRTAAQVTSVLEDGADRISVRLRNGESIAAERVIIAVPLRVAATTLSLLWASPNLLSAMHRTPTWMATHAKAVALYNRPFWREMGLSGRIASRNGPLVEAHDHSDCDSTYGAIFGFVAWPSARRHKDPDGLKQAILDQLSECFGDAARHPSQLFVQDWAANANIVTDIDLTQPVAHPDVGPAILRQAQLGGRVRFAVSEVSNISPGLIEGAFAAAENAALDLLNASA